MASLGTATADPGESATGSLEVGEMRDGTAAKLPVAVINGRNDGQTVYIQAASDGDELNGVGVVRELVPRLDPTTMSGTVLVVGIVNIYGFHRAKHRNPIDDTKINRAYPGNDQGSASERIAAATFEAAKQADVALDLHQGSTSRMIEETRVRCGQNHRLHRQCLELAKVFGTGYVLDKKGPDNQLARVAPDHGVPTIDPELGASVGWDHEAIETGVEGVRNVLRHCGLLEGTPGRSKQLCASGFDQYGAPAGGLVEFTVDLGERVKAGDQLAQITDVFGAEASTITADSDGLVWRMRRLPQVAAGEYVCSVGTGLNRY